MSDLDNQAEAMFVYHPSWNTMLLLVLVVLEWRLTGRTGGDLATVSVLVNGI